MAPRARSLVRIASALVLLCLATPRALAQSMFSHQIPLKLPKAVNGMQPELALQYSPGSGNGIVGVGWQLTGTPFIARVNYGEGIDFAGGDTYGHSELGILVRQLDGSYRTKKETFTRFVPSGTCGEGPCSWIAYDRSGKRSHYGSTADSRYLWSGSPSVRTWGISKVEDLFGNWYEVAYSGTASSGYFIPTVITYAKGPGISAYRTVEFGWEERSDTYPTYPQNSLHWEPYRLARIDVKSSGALLRRYALQYECGSSTGTCSTRTGRSRLVSVTEYGSDGTTAVPAQRFEWQVGGGGFGSSTTYASPTDFAGRGTSGPLGVRHAAWGTGARIADVNGDGRPDIVKGLYTAQLFNNAIFERTAWLNTATGWVQSAAYALPTDAAGRQLDNYGDLFNAWDYGLRIVDLNGDGLPDLVKGHYNYGTSDRRAWLNNGGNCSTTACAWTLAPEYAPQADFAGRDSGAPWGWNYGFEFAELNGDHLPDLVKGHYNYGTSDRRAWLNTGSGWQASIGYAPPADIAGRDGSAPHGWDYGLRIADVDGDGRSDLLKGHYSYGSSDRRAWRNDGAGWTLDAAYAPPTEFAGRESYAEGGWDFGVRLIDVNADGKIDFLKGHTAMVLVTINPVPTVTTVQAAWLNDGATWISTPAYAPPAPFAARFVWQGVEGNRFAWDEGLRVADVNGDGLPDLLKASTSLDGSSNDRRAWVASGRTCSTAACAWTLAPEYTPEVNFVARDNNLKNGWDMGVRVVDLDGDGKTDLLRGYEHFKTSYRGAWTVPGPFPDLLVEVQNGLGGTVSVEYDAATQLAGVIDRSSASPGIPYTAPQQLATRVMTSDGRGKSFAAKYVYRDARWLPGTIPERRNLGFGSVDAIDEPTGQFTRTLFNQTPGKEGTVAQLDAFTRSGQLVSRKTNTYDVVSPADGTELVREREQAASAYELGSFAFTQRTETDYDSYGNPTVKRQYADSLPTLVVTTTFANDPISWILGRITEVKTTSGGVTLGWMQNTWHNNNVTAKREWLDTTNSWITTTMSYDANGNLRSVTEPWTGDGLTRTTTTEYDARFRAYPWKVTNALGHVTERTYNDDGLAVSFTDSNGNVTTTEWDVLGRKKKETRPDGGTTEYRYVSYGDPNTQYNEVITKVDATRTAWRREYFDGTGFKYEVRSNGDCGAYVAVSSEKDYAGRAYRNSQPYCAGAAPVWTTTLYDDAGRPQFTKLPDNRQVEYRRGVNYEARIDQNGRETRKYFDARNRVTEIVDPAGHWTRYGYDPVGRMISATVDPGEVTMVTYDSLNRKTSVVDPRLGPTTWTFDAAGNRTSVTSSGKTVTFTYDALNRITLKQPQGETAVGYTYDEAGIANAIGRTTTVVDEGGTTRYAYEPSGQIRAFTKSIDGSSFSQSFTYDVAGRVTRLTYPDGSYADYAYTDGGNLSTLSLDGVSFATWTGYNADGKPANVTYGNGVGTTYGYGGMGHMTSLSTTKGATRLQDLTYDWYSLPNTGGVNIGSITDNRSDTWVVDRTGTLVNTDETQWYEYDDLYRLTRAVGVWGDKSYGYDAAGNPQTFGGLVNRTLVFSGQQVTSGTGLSDVTYEAGNMKHKVLDGTAWDYTWTAEGLLASVSKNGLLTASMTYDAAGQRVRKVYSPTTGPAVTTAYVGNMYEKRTFSDGSPERHTLHLYANGYLVASVTKSGNIITASNDANGWRAEWAVGSLYDGTSARGAALKALHSTRGLATHPMVRRWFVPAILILLALSLIIVFARALVQGLFSRRFSPGIRFAALSLLLAFGMTACSNGGRRGDGDDALIIGDTRQGPPPGTSFYHRNHVNSSTVITDASGTETTRMVYLPFGEISQPNSAGVDAVTSKYTGKELDEETGLYYYGARYYDPAIGRFISADSIVPSVTDGQAFNRYSYARNNPVIYTDPTGHFFEFIGNALRAAWNAVQALGDAIADAARWVGNKAAQFGRYLANSMEYAATIIDSMRKNPLAIASFVIAVAWSVAVANPGPLIVWFKATGASIAAQSLALAAGVRNPTVLSAIAVVGGFLGAGPSWSSFYRAAGSWALNEGLTRLQGDQASELAALNALMIFLIVNGLSKAFGPKPTAQDPMSPEERLTRESAKGYRPITDAELRQAIASYADLNLSVGAGFGATGGIMVTPQGEGYPYLGGGVGLGAAGALTYSTSDPSPGWNAGIQGSFLGYSVQWGYDTQGITFWENGVGAPAGLSVSLYYVFPKLQGQPTGEPLIFSP